MGREADAVAFFARLAEAPHRADFYHTLRQVECLYPDRPRLGRARRPADEGIRLGQDPDLSFAPTPVAALETGGRAPRLLVRLFGLLGPNGPMPIHLTEYARERLRNAGDPTLCRFLDVFNHRFLSFLYQAWAQAQPHVNHDRPETDRFVVYVGAMIGVAPRTQRRRDALPDASKLFHAWALVRHVRNEEGVVAILRQYFRVPARLEQFVGHWMPLGPRERTYLAREGATLNRGAVLGARIWDRQHKVRVRLGPLTLGQYEAFLPGGEMLRELVHWMRFYCSLELEWDVQLELERREVPVLALGCGRRLGWTTWLGHRRSERHADDLCLNAEAFHQDLGVAVS